MMSLLLWAVGSLMQFRVKCLIIRDVKTDDSNSPSDSSDHNMNTDVLVLNYK